MKKMFYLLILLNLMGIPAGAYPKDDPAISSSPAIADYLVIVAVNGATPLANLQVLAASLGTAPSSLDLLGTASDSRTLEVRYGGGPGRTAIANAAPIGEISFIKVSPPASTQAGGSLTGNVSSSPAINLTQGSLAATFPNGTAVSGTFRDLKTR